MSGAGFMRLAKLVASKLKPAARHNKREIQKELGADSTIDSKRSHLNRCLFGPATAEGVAKLVPEKLALHGISKYRKDAVLAVEVIFSLPAGHRLDEAAYFADCARWAADEFGGWENVLTVDVHRDEAQPHAHVLLMPLIDGRLQGSDAVGGRAKMLERQTKFHESVASAYGLQKPNRRLYGSDKAHLAREVLLRLKADPAAQSVAWPLIRDSVERDPSPFALALGIEIVEARKRTRTMVEIFTSKGRGAKVEKPVEFQAKPYRVRVPENEQTLGLCRVPNSANVNSDQKRPLTDRLTEARNAEAQAKARHAPRPAEARNVEAQAADAETVFTRIRDEEMDASHYCPELGEFIGPGRMGAGWGRAA